MICKYKHTWVEHKVLLEYDFCWIDRTLTWFLLLTAILGFHGMLNQVQYHQAFVEQKDTEEQEKDRQEGKGSGFQGKYLKINVLSIKQMQIGLTIFT